MTNEARALGRVKIATQRLLANQPFHARLIADMDPRPSTNLDTMGVTAKDGRVLLYFNPEFVESCTLCELEGVLQHEVHHILFGHLTEDPAEFPEREARIIAEEVTVNEYIKGPLPGDPITLDQYPMLPPGEDTDTRYHRLVAAGIGRGGPGNGQSMDQNPGSGDQSTTRQDQNSSSVQTLDDHSLWEEAQSNAEDTAEAITEAVACAVSSLSSQDAKRALDALPEQVAELCDAHIEGKTREDVLQRPEGRTNWQQILRQVLTRTLRAKRDWGRPPRRLPHLVGVIPGRRQRQKGGRILAVIDTSGSINSETLSDISAELAKMKRDKLSVTVVECDDEIQRVYEYEGPIQSVWGRGGTDLRPPLARGFLDFHKPDAVVYFTDGYGPAPDRAPRVPVFWCITAGGRQPAAWGKAIFMEARAAAA